MGGASGRNTTAYWLGHVNRKSIWTLEWKVLHWLHPERSEDHLGQLVKDFCVKRLLFDAFEDWQPYSQYKRHFWGQAVPEKDFTCINSMAYYPLWSRKCIMPQCFELLTCHFKGNVRRMSEMSGCTYFVPATTGKRKVEKKKSHKRSGMRSSSPYAHPRFLSLQSNDGISQRPTHGEALGTSDLQSGWQERIT